MVHSMPCRNPCRLYIHLAFTYSIGPSSVVWSELGPAPPCPPMRVLEVWWSRALSLMCELGPYNANWNPLSFTQTSTWKNPVVGKNPLITQLHNITEHMSKHFLSSSPQITYDMLLHQRRNYILSFFKGQTERVEISTFKKQRLSRLHS